MHVKKSRPRPRPPKYHPRGFMSKEHSGLFECTSCGKRTRNTPLTVGSGLCPECFRKEEAGVVDPGPVRGSDEVISTGRVTKSIKVRRALDERCRPKAKSMSGSGDTLSGIDWSDPSLTPESMKEQERLAEVIELEAESDGDQYDVGEPHDPVEKLNSVMAEHAPISDLLTGFSLAEILEKAEMDLDDFSEDAPGD